MKDPTVIVKAGSEECYAYVGHANELSENVTIDDIDTNWQKVEDGGRAVYRCADPVQPDALNDTVLPPVFGHISIAKGADYDQLSKLTDKIIRQGLCNPGERCRSYCCKPAGSEEFGKGYEC